VREAARELIQGRSSWHKPCRDIHMTNAQPWDVMHAKFAETSADAEFIGVDGDTRDWATHIEGPEFKRARLRSGANLV